MTDRKYFAAPTIVNAPTYDVDYNWQVVKFVTGPKTADVPEGTDATFPYEVRLKALDATRSDFGGTLTVTNANALPMVGTISAEISPELLGVGYIIGPYVASIMSAGGVLA